MDDHERELRRLRLEARDQQRDVEGAEAELDTSTAALTDVLRDWAAQGRIVQLDAVDRQRRGRVVHVGDSVVTLSLDDDVREVVALRHVEGVVMGTVADTTASSWSSGHPRTLVAHMRGLVGDEQFVIIDRRVSAPVRGELLGVAERHLTIRIASGDTMVIPLDAVVAVTTA